MFAAAPQETARRARGRIDAARTLFAAALVMATSASLAQADVLTVGVGEDFEQIQDAVMAAADGDVLLVKPGTYTTVRISNKSLTIVGDGGVPEIERSVRVLDLSAEKLVVLQNLRNKGIGATFGYKHGLEILDCQGQVVVDSCIWSGVAAPRVGVSVERSDAVTISNTTCVGLYGPEPAGSGGAGLLVIDSRVSIENCTLRGGSGGNGDSGPDLLDGGDGGHAIEVDGTSARVHVAGTTLIGGKGGQEDCSFGECGEVGLGGSAVVAAGSGALITLRENDLQPGLGGVPHSSGGTELAPALSIDPGNTLIDHASASVSLGSNSPVRSADTIELTLDGPPGDLATLWFSAAPGWEPLLGKEGVFQLGFPLALNTALLLGSFPADGALSLSLTAPALPAGLEAMSVFAQSVTISPTLQVRVNGSTVVLLLHGV